MNDGYDVAIRWRDKAQSLQMRDYWQSVADGILKKRQERQNDDGK